MPIKHPRKKYLFILIIVLLIFQLIPGAAASVEHSNNHASESSLILLNRAIKTDISLLNRQNQKSPFHSLSVEHSDSIIDNICSADISEEVSCYFKTPIDYRSEIKQSIPHYFNGSKYRNTFLFIQKSQRM